MRTDERYLSSFSRRARLTLPHLSLTALALALSDAMPRASHREDLCFALRRVEDPTSALTVSQKVEIAAYFMPLLVDEDKQPAPAQVQVPPQTSLRVVQQPSRNPQRNPVLQARVVLGVGAQLTRLTLTRAGQVVATTTQDTLRFEDARPVPGGGVLYKAVAEFSNAPDQTKQVRVVLPVPALYGVGTTTPTTAEVLALQELGLNTEKTFSLTFAGRRQRMLLWLPKAVGTVQAIRNPLFGTTNLLASFQATPLTLPFEGLPVEGTLYASYSSITSTSYLLEFDLA